MIARLALTSLLFSTVSFAQGLGTHDQFAGSGIVFHDWVPNAEFLNFEGADDCWGYTSPSGREYAIIGTTGAIGFAEVTNPSEVQVVAGMPTIVSNWHDVKVYQEYAYSVSEGGGGIAVFDLTQIDSGIVTQVGNVTDGGSLATHNLAIDETSGYLYRCDGGGFVGGLRIYDLTNPAAPAFVGSWTVRDVHDAQVVTYDSGPFAGKQIGFLASDAPGFDGLTVVDLTDKSNIVILSDAQYPNAIVAHQGWLNDDKTIFYYGDEADESSFGFTTRTHMFDVADLNNISYIGFFTNGNTASDHNVYPVGNRVFGANFMSGLRVFDSTNPTSPVEIAWFDTQLASDQAKTEGLWGNYPFFPSGTVIGSDEVKGLFVWRLGEPKLTFSFPQGLPDPLSPDGESILIHIDEETAGDLEAGSPTLFIVVSDFEVSAPLIDVGGGDFVANLPPLPCGTVLPYRIEARSTDGLLWRSPASTEDDHHFTLVAYDETVVTEYDMEAGLDWIGGLGGDTANQGTWTRGVPNGTAAQTEIDRTPGPGNTACWFTGQATAGLDNGVGDVDGGTTTLVSPPLDLSALSDPYIDYWRWYHNDGGANPDDDVFTVDVTDDGSTWVNVETVGPAGRETRGGWRRHAFRVLDHVTLSTTVRVRYRATDDNVNPSVVEAAIDDVRVIELNCGDCNGNAVDDALDISMGTSLDLDGDGVPDECQPLSADVATVSLSAGGSQVLTLDAGSIYGAYVYWMFGSFTGTFPGLDFGEVTLPLNYDAYFMLTFTKPGLAVFGNFLSALDGSGQATASFNIPPASDPGLAGVTLYHAYTAAATFGNVHFASNAIPVMLVP